VLVSPLIEPVSEQVDLVRAAQARGIRVATLIASWDNLTNKGDLKTPTSRIFVWNAQQKREAIELHRVPAESVVVTGSQVFDRWFDRAPSVDRAAFCQRVGLPDNAPFVLFTGSSIFIARAEHEMPFVRRWIEALRASSDPAVRDLRVLVRPHPYNGRAWTPELFDDMPNVAVWPRGGYDPIDPANRDGFFDSMYHCAAVVGINTSAMIESAIVGRPVLSISGAEFAATQEGTLHFRHLLPEHGGFLRVASTFDEHVAQLGAVLRDPVSARCELEQFVGSFIRPFGIHQSATPRLVDAILEYGRTPAPTPAKRTAGDRWLAVALLPLALVARWFPPESGSRRGVLRQLREWGGKRRRRGEAKAPERAAGAVKAQARRGIPRVTILALVSPFAIALAITLGFAALELSGRTPLSEDRPANIAEAAGLGLESEVLRFLRRGSDPLRIYPVRPEIISSSVRRVSVSEAALWSRRLKLVRLLDREGALPRAERARLACLATGLGTEDIVRYLAPRGVGNCDPEAAYAVIEARGR
jgi:hypothetical protein